MKITLCQLMLAVTLSGLCSAKASYGQKILEKKITVSLSNKSLDDVLQELSKIAGIKFIYSKSLVQTDEMVSVQAKQDKLGDLLENLLSKNGIRFNIVNNFFVLSRISASGAGTDESIVVTDDSQLKAIIIKGTVTDEKGMGLPGVSVLIKGTTTGVTTDVVGAFSISVPDESAVLVFSYVSFETIEMPLSGKTTINVQLKPSTKGLNEVIVVAYGNTTKRTSTGALQTVNASELKDIPVSQIGQQLQGKLSGVQISQNTGKPGQGITVRIRGAASISAGSDPLYVVDGFPIVGNISTINPDEIETISVLKDAASTSLYGSRAANGVVLITTKHAKNGQTKVSAAAYTGVQQVPQKGRLKMMDGEEFAQFKKESYEDLGQPVPSVFQNPAQYGKGYNLYDALLRIAPMQNYSVNLSTGNEKSTTSAVAGVFNQDGVLRNSNYQRYSLRLNSEYKFSSKVKVGLNAAPNYSINNTPSSDGAFAAYFIDPVNPGGLLYNSLLAWPIIPYKNADGSLPLLLTLPGVSPFAQPNFYRALTEITNKTNQFGLLTNAYIEYKPIDGLTLKSTYNIDMGNTLFSNFNPSTASTAYSTTLPTLATAVQKNSSYLTWLNENTATYHQTIKDHDFEVLAGFTAQRFRSDFSQIRATTFPDDRIHTIGSALVIDKANTYNDIQEYSLVSYLARLNYSYKNRYLLSASIRSDGSSRFGTNNKYGTFPSASLGWIVSDEDFMKKMPVLSFMKVRGSYGVLGNNNIGNYTQYATLNTTASTVFGNTVQGGSAVTSLSNANLGWEKTTEFDMGADFGFLDNRITLTYDFYTKKTSNLLYGLAVPQESGFGTFTGNVGTFKFWGHEITINSQNLTGAFKWNTSFNISFSDNKVLALSNLTDRIYGDGTITQVGHRIGQFYGVVQLGVYKDQADFDSSPKLTSSQVGTVKYEDINGDGKITYGGNNDDRTIIGNPFPKFIYGITNSFSYKRFDMNIVGSGSYGNDVAMRTDEGTTNLDGVFNVLAAVKDRWRSPANPGAGLYGKTTSSTADERSDFSTRFIHHASFFTIKNISLGYTVPFKNNKFLSGIRVYGSVQQVYVFTSYPGSNPEVSLAPNGTTPSALSLGSDYGAYPVPRTYTLGLNVNLK